LARNKGKSTVSKILKYVIIILFLLTAGICGYAFTIYYFSDPDADILVANQIQQEQEPITKASIDDISKNLIYGYDTKTGEINNIILEIYHCKKKQLTYITIPTRTQFTMSDTLYRKLVPVYPSIPQVIKLSAISKYLDDDTRFDYGVLILEDLLRIDISYYTAIPQEIFDEIFTMDEITRSKDVAIDDEQSENDDNKEMVHAAVFKTSYKKKMGKLKTKEDLSNYIEELYSEITSNLSFHDKMNYLDSYCRTSIDNVSFDLIRGDDRNSAFVVNTTLVEMQLAQLTTADIVE
jgi:hypothetical protein